MSRVDVLDIADPTNPTLAFTFAVTGRPNSVAFHDGVVAVAVENSPKPEPGFVQLFDTEGAF